MNKETPSEKRKGWRNTPTGLYILALVATIVVVAIGLYAGESGDLVLAVPFMAILIAAVVSDRKAINIPPATMLLMILSFYLGLATRVFGDGSWALVMVSSIVSGINLALLGLIAVFILMKSTPGLRDENPLIVAGFSSSVAMSVYAFMMMAQHYLAKVWSIYTPQPMDTVMNGMLGVTLGAIIVNLLYIRYRDHPLFRLTVNQFLDDNSGVLGLADRERMDILEMIHDGESERLEFKSTLRTNLQTGETDKRMEKAVLKTLVAFMNSDGGTLLVGVSDDGSICGIDIESFENDDKLNLHFTNMIASTIGNSFLPYINFKLIEMEEGRLVLRVKCDPTRKAVFLKEGKTELFYVRSGPSSVELTGMNLVNYVNNRGKVRLKN